jgi:endoglucanase
MVDTSRRGLVTPSRAARRGILAAAAAIVAIAAVVTVLTIVPDGRGAADRPVPRQVPVDIAFYADPEDSAVAWVDANAADPLATVIKERIAGVPKPRWFTDYDPDGITDEVRRYVAPAVAADRVPVLVMYAIPHRDCRGPSRGGAPTAAGYRQWADNFAKGLGPARAWVIVEPDSLAQADCLTELERDERFDAVASAARSLRRHSPQTRIYLDGGHSAWKPADTMAERLERAAAARYANGIAVNMANFNTTASELRYGAEVLDALGEEDLRLVIDTSRNGNGRLARGTCDPPGARLGAEPTADTGTGWIDAFLWIKPPGHSDGCLAAPGIFVPHDAYRLAQQPSTNVTRSRHSGR